MKIKNNFILRQVAGSWIAMPVGDDSVNIEGVLSLNDAGAFLWKCLENDCQTEDLVRSLTQEYDVDPQMALNDVLEFKEKLHNFGCLE